MKKTRRPCNKGGQKRYSRKTDEKGWKPLIHGILYFFINGDQVRKKIIGLRPHESHLYSLHS